MECKDVRERLLDVLDGLASPEERRAVEEHVKGCEGCRTELENLQRGLHGLSAYVQKVKQPRIHRSTDRLVRMLRAMERGRNKAAQVTWRRVAVGVVMVAVVGCVCLMLSGDILLFRLLKKGHGTAGIAQTEPYAQGMQVVLTGAAGEKGQSVVTEYVKSQATPLAQPPPGAERIVLANSPGIYVPVQNVLYDSEETGYWW